MINENYSNGEVVSVQTLADKGILDRGVSTVKIIATGELDKKLTFDEAIKMSEGVKAKVGK